MCLINGCEGRRRGSGSLAAGKASALSWNFSRGWHWRGVAAFGAVFRDFGQSGVAACFGAQATSSFCGTSLPILGFPLALQNLSEMLLDMEVVVVCWIRPFPFLHPESLDKTSLFQHRSCRMGEAEGLERGNPIRKNARDPWSWRDDTSGDGGAILETE